jgi:putative two-component system response regulator
MSGHSKGSILVVDDDTQVLQYVSFVLADYGYAVTPCSDPYEAIEKFQANRFDALLTDMKMPTLSGLDLINMARAYDKDVPVVLMTGFAELDMAIEAIHRGVFDFLNKPMKPEYITHAIDKAVKFRKLLNIERDYKQDLEETIAERTQKLQDMMNMLKSATKEIIHRLVVVSEYRDTDTGDHVKRIGLYGKALSSALAMPDEFTEMIEFASSLHDIGKVAIPDKILLKPGKLSDDEFDLIKSHTTIGAKMISDSQFPGMDMAVSIVLNHHERWDGTGYPSGLRGEEIPLEGRIVMLSDQYDALRSKRPYKPPFDHEKAFKIITEGDGRSSPDHFDPEVLKAFIDVSRKFDEIFRSNED